MDATDNSYHVVTGATGATLDGVTISEGNADGTNCPGTQCGGGVYNTSSSPTLTNVTLSGNTASFGGGMYNISSSPKLTNVTLSGNSATVDGGGVYNTNSSSPTPTVNGAVTVDVLAGVATNAAGNGNRAATTFSVTYARSNSNADLSDLTLSSGTLSPTFDAATQDYTATVPFTVTSLIVTPTVSDNNATVKVNDTSAATPVPLIVGSTTVTVTVTAQDGTTTKIYTIHIIRAGAGEAEVAITQSYKLEKGTGTTAQAVSLAAMSNTLTLTITVRNNGPDAVTGVVITDMLPTAAVGTTWRWTCVGADGGVCGTTNGTGNLNEVLGLLPLNGNVTFVVTGSLLNPNNWSNTPSVTAPTGVVDVSTANNSVTVGNFLTFVPLVVK